MMESRSTIVVASLLLLMANCPTPSAGGATEQFQSLIGRYDHDYSRVEFDDSRIQALRSSEAEARHEIGLKQTAPMKYGDMDVHHRVHLSLDVYATRQARDAALEEWLRRFTTLGDPIVLGEHKRYVKSPPLFAIVSETNIVVLTTRCETEGREWERNIRDAVAVFGHGDHTTLRVGCGGPVEWSTVEAAAPN